MTMPSGIMTSSVAINALLGYVAIDSGLTYKDTLSILYFNAKSYVSSLILAEEVYKARLRIRKQWPELQNAMMNWEILKQPLDCMSRWYPRPKAPTIFINWL